MTTSGERKHPRWLRSLRLPLYGLVLLALLPAFAVVLGFGVSERRSEAARAREEALDFAHLAAHDEQDLIQSTRELLELLGGEPEMLPQFGAECSAQLARILPSYPYLTNMGAADLQGEVYCSGLPFTTPVNIRDRGYFQRVLARSDFAVGEFQVGRITGRVAINFGYPVRDESGVMRGVLYAGLSLDWLEQLATNAGLPPGSSVTVIDSQGTVLARFPDGGDWVGKQVPEAPLFQAVSTGAGQGTFDAVGLDGVSKLYGFTSLLTDRPGAVYISVGIPAAQAYTRVDSAIARAGAALVAVLVLGLISTWAGSEFFILRRARALVEVSQRLASGDLGAPACADPTTAGRGDGRWIRWPSQPAPARTARPGHGQLSR
jgi:hypothetical protein